MILNIFSPVLKLPFKFFCQPFDYELLVFCNLDYWQLRCSSKFSYLMAVITNFTIVFFLIKYFTRILLWTCDRNFVSGIILFLSLSAVVFPFFILPQIFTKLRRVFISVEILLLFCCQMNSVRIMNKHMPYICMICYHVRVFCRVEMLCLHR